MDVFIYVRDIFNWVSYTSSSVKDIFYYLITKDNFNSNNNDIFKKVNDKLTNVKILCCYA